MTKKHVIDHTDSDLVDLYEDMRYAEYEFDMFRELLSFVVTLDDDEMFDFVDNYGDIASARVTMLSMVLCERLGIEPDEEEETIISEEGITAIPVKVYPCHDDFYLDGDPYNEDA